MTVGINNQADDGIIEKYCYNDDPNICGTDGGLYQWDEMMQYTNIGGDQGVCPIGWHLPTDNEWKTLEIELGMTQAEVDSVSWRGTDQGDQKKTSAVCSGTAICGTSGFQSLLAGFRNPDGSFSFRGRLVFYWSSTDPDLTTAWKRHLESGDGRVSRGSILKVNGFFVRCVKD